jgi:peptidoglycan/xylan/chitin deacetylase (PgdA/CDA1 family)
MKPNDKNHHKGVLVLVYHSYHLNFRDCFEGHIEYLKKNCCLLSPQDFCDYYHLRRDHGKRSVLITLDDGYIADYTIAFPILKKHGAHAIAFVMTDPYYTGISGKDWWKDVKEVIEIGSHTVSHAEIYISNLLAGFVTPVNGEIKKMYCMVKGVEYQAGFPLYQRGPELINRQVIPPDQLLKAIRQVVQEPGFFEQKDWQKKLENIVHRHSHPYRYETDEIKEKRVKTELSESKLEIEKMVNSRCRFLAYPWGAYDEEVIQIAKETGYQFAFTANEGLVSPEDNPFRMNRVNVPLESSGASIESIINKYFAPVPSEGE